MDTNIPYSPHDLLPAPEPRTVSPPPDQFYQTVAKHLIKDTVRITQNGLPIDLDRVEDLEATLDTQLASVQQTLNNNTYIKQYVESRYQSQIADYKAEQTSKLRTPDQFIKPFKYNNMDHRSYFMHIYSQDQAITPPTELLPNGLIPKWPANTVKKLAKTRPLLTKLLAGQLLDSHPVVRKAMSLFAQHKCDIFNKSYQEKIHEPKVPYPEFSPASSKQKLELFTMLNIESEATSKTTGLPSWSRDQVERVNRETSDPILLELTQALIDHSFAAIVRNNFIEAFYRYTVNDRLYGNYKLLGAKSG